jgi:asparagine synthase (glutamine-hydrolysing)
MCGIVGYWSISGAFADQLRGALPASTRTLEHRGPDAQGTWWADNADVGLGHRRLSILDLSESGSQPMVAQDADYAIVYNGEVYNYKELRADLSSLGYRFKGGSDTEVVLAAFREWGPDCVNRFIGMFAVAIWDGQNQRLTLFRDRAGVKPLYWYWDGEIFVFASELKALLMQSPRKPKVDYTAAGEFLQYGFIAQPRSIYEGVQKLHSGTRITVERGKAPTVARYWSLSEARLAYDRQLDEEEALAELETLLLDAVKYRLVADVPVGLFLSGGIDSSIVACLLKRLGVDLETFTIGFREHDLDETSAARAVAEALGLRHHVRYLEPNYVDGILQTWPDMFDEPFGDGSGVPMFLVSQWARQNVKVALSADGGDELFCGYSGYQEIARRMRAHDSIPQPLRRVAAEGLRLVEPALLAAGRIGGISRRGMIVDRVKKAADYLGAANSLDAVRAFRSVWQPGEVGAIMGRTYADPRLRTIAWDGVPIEQIAAVGFQEYLQEDVMTKVDRSSMAASLECREPLLDHRVIAFAFSLPHHLRIGELGSKHLLRKLLYRYLPRELVDRPKKGFAVPISHWVKELHGSGALSASMESLVTKLGMDERALAAAFASHSNTLQGRNRLWLLHVLGQWAGRWL